MKYILRKEVDINYTATEQVLTNRGILFGNIEDYLNTTDNDILDPINLGQEKMELGAAMLKEAIEKNLKTLIVVDCDCDGFTSSALMLNYLYDMNPDYAESIEYFIHSGKQHGLSDAIEMIRDCEYKFVIVPDAGTNDKLEHEELARLGVKCLVLDHHEREVVIEDGNTVIINNQIADNYENKDLSGVGVAWQFCRYLDKINGDMYADDYLDLVALGNVADMMSLLSLETKHLINKGYMPKRIKNPFIYYLWQKNIFKLGEHFTGFDSAFYLAPLVNCVQRSGTMEEKEILLKSMIKFHAFKEIPSTKRGEKGKTEQIVTQAVRMVGNVKNRQTKNQDAGMKFLEDKIVSDNMMDNKVLLFRLPVGAIDKNIAGLVANKIAAKYQRPTCILFECTLEDKSIAYQGSSRGYEPAGVTDFKKVCEETDCTNWTVGHANAFGLSLPSTQVESFIEKTNEALKTMSTEPMYQVDYIWSPSEIRSEHILDVASLKFLWGKDFPEALVAIEGITVTPADIAVYKKTTTTLKITIPNTNISIMKFFASQEDCDFFSEGTHTINVVGTCSANEWCGNMSAQIMLTDYEVVGEKKITSYMF